MKYLIAFLLTIQAFGSTDRFASLNSLDFKYDRFVHAQDPMFYGGMTPKDRIRLCPNFDLFYNYVFWDNQIKTVMDQYQYRLIEWDYSLGFRVTNYLKIQYSHLSNHMLDVPASGGHYGLDAVGFSIRVYGEEKRGESLFGSWGD